VTPSFSGCRWLTAQNSAWAGGFTRFTGALGFLGMIPKMLAMKRYIERILRPFAGTVAKG